MCILIYSKLLFINFSTSCSPHFFSPSSAIYLPVSSNKKSNPQVLIFVTRRTEMMRAAKKKAKIKMLYWSLTINSISTMIAESPESLPLLTFFLNSLSNLWRIEEIYFFFCFKDSDFLHECAIGHKNILGFLIKYWFNNENLSLCIKLICVWSFWGIKCYCLCAIYGTSMELDRRTKLHRSIVWFLFFCLEFAIASNNSRPFEVSTF